MKMVYLVKQDFVLKPVLNPYMLHKGGVVKPGTYTRRAKNIISSPVLRRRMEQAAELMIANCSLPDACTTNPDNVGKVRVTKRGVRKVMRLCTPEEVQERIRRARECAATTLATGPVGGGA